MPEPKARHPSLAWVLPFAAFIVLLALGQIVPLPVWVRLVVPLAIAVTISRDALGPPPSKPLLSILLGIAVFVVWIGPDLITPAWRQSWLFNNPITGHPAANTAPAQRLDPVYLVLRIAVSVVAVPILEELFWRGWMMRWLIDSHHFDRVRLGSYAPFAFWITALLFASEHGPYWDVGLLTGIIYNWWMIRTRNLWDLILTHAVTNAALAAYVVSAGQWQYWL